MAEGIQKYVDEYGLRLTNLCVKLCRSRNDAEDLYQETWLTIIKNFNRYDQSRPFDKWSYSVCVNTYRNLYNRQKRAPLVTDEIEGFGQPSVFDPDQLALREAVAELEEKLKLVVILYYFEDLSLDDVAHILKIPQGTAKSRLFKAREVLKRRIQHD